MKKFVSVLMTVMFLLTLVSGTTVFAAEYDLSTLENGYLAANLFSARNEMSYTSGGLPMNFKAEGSWLEFTVSVPEDGLYDVSARFGAYASTGTYGLSVDGGTVKKIQIAHYGSSSKDFAVAPVYLTAGTHTVKIECIDRPDTETNVVPIHRLIFTLNSEDTISAQSQGYISACEAIMFEGSGILSFQPAHWAEYEIGVSETAWYKAYVNVGATAQWGLNIVANEGTEDETTADKICDATGGFSTQGKFELGTIKLTKGTNKIKVTNNRGTAVYFYGITLEKTSVATDLSTLENGYLSADKFTARYNSTYTYGALPMNLTAEGSWLEYSVKAPSNGIYDVSVRVGAYACTGTIGISVDNGNMKKIQAENYSGSSKNFAAAPVYLTAGDHTIRLQCVDRPDTETNEFPISGITFALNDGNEISAQSQGYDSACEEVMFAGSGILSFQPTHYAEYEIGVSKTAWYKAYVVVGTTAQWGLNIKANENEAYASEADKIHDGTTGYGDGQKFELGKIRLFEGQNKVKVTNNRGTAVYFYGIVLEKISTALAETGATEISAPSYTSAYSALGSGENKVQYDIGNENGNLSFQGSDWAEYDIIAPQTGEYQIAMTVGAPHAMAMSLLVNDTDSYEYNFDATATGALYTTAKLNAGVITLKEGRNTIKVTNTLSGCYFKSFELSRFLRELSVWETVSAMDYNLGQNLGYYDTSPIGGLEAIYVEETDSDAMELISEEWFTYDVEVPTCGKYGIKLAVASDDTEEKTVQISANGGTPVQITVTGNGATIVDESTIALGDFILSDMAELSLQTGTNTIKIENVTELTDSEDIIDDFYLYEINIYQPEIKFYAESTSGTVVTEVPDGTLCATAMFGGLMTGESVDYYLAVYEVNADGIAKLVGIDMGNTTVNKNSLAEMQIDGIEKNENCTYTAKVFLWNNQAGAVYPMN